MDLSRYCGALSSLPVSYPLSSSLQFPGAAAALGPGAACCDPGPLPRAGLYLDDEHPTTGASTETDDKLASLSVRELKARLDVAGVPYDGISEKHELVACARAAGIAQHDTAITASQTFFECDRTWEKTDHITQVKSSAPKWQIPLEALNRGKPSLRHLAKPLQQPLARRSCFGRLPVRTGCRCVQHVCSMCAACVRVPCWRGATPSPGKEMPRVSLLPSS